MNRTIAPGYTQPKELNLQFPDSIELNNGVVLYWNKDVKDDSVKLDIEWCAGSKYQNKKLVSSFTNKLLLSGFEGKTAAEIAEEMDYYGGYAQREMDRDHAGLSLYGLTENISAIFAVFAESFEKCVFPESEFQKELSVTLANFKIDSKKVKNLCRRRFNQVIFGPESQYGQVAEEEDFEKIERVDLEQFYETYYRNSAPTIFLVGNVSEDFIEQLRQWSSLFGNTKREAFVPGEAIQSTERIDVEVPGAIQSAIRVGRLMFDKKHPDYFGFQLLNTILGGYFGSRLMANIREDKGYTYGIGSGVSVMEDWAHLYIMTEVAVEVKEDTIAEIFNELALLRNELIPEEELMRVKNYMLGDFLRHSNGPIAMMENFKNIHFNKLEKNYYSDFIRAIHALTAADLKELANKYLQEKDLTVVTAG